MRFIAWLLILLASLCSPSQAAELRVVNRDTLPLARIAAGECSVLLSGPIKPGDAARLESLLASDQVKGEPRPFNLTFIFDANEPKATSLCLDSKGRSFAEALELIRVIQEWHLVTVVPARATCLSACAMAFLAGHIASFTTDGGQESPYRVLHVSATLGFHAPFLEIKQSGVMEV